MRRCEGVEVPRQYVQGGKIILNVSSNATSMLSLGNEVVRFRARFGACDLRRQRADRRGARHLRARDGAGDDLLGSRHAAAAASAAERAGADDHRQPSAAKPTLKVIK